METLLLQEAEKCSLVGCDFNAKTLLAKHGREPSNPHEAWKSLGAQMREWRRHFEKKHAGQVPTTKQGKLGPFDTDWEPDWKTHAPSALDMDFSSPSESESEHESKRSRSGSTAKSQ